MNIESKPVVQQGAATAERRTSPRVDVCVEISGYVSSSPVQLVNIGEGGCLVYAGCSLLPGEVQTYRFKTSPDADELAFQARVVHVVGVTGAPGTACVAGLEFVGDSAQQREAIKKLLVAAAAP